MDVDSEIGILTTELKHLHTYLLNFLFLFFNNLIIY